MKRRYYCGIRAGVSALTTPSSSKSRPCWKAQLSKRGSPLPRGYPAQAETACNRTCCRCQARNRLLAFPLGVVIFTVIVVVVVVISILLLRLLHFSAVVST